MVTVGFLGGVVIMKDGFHISGLTTAASIWTSASIGIMMGVGFYGAAILLALVCAVSMELVRSLERSVARSMPQCHRPVLVS